MMESDLKAAYHILKTIEELKAKARNIRLNMNCSYDPVTAHDTVIFQINEEDLMAIVDSIEKRISHLKETLKNKYDIRMVDDSFSI